jgi:hypothetical protein
MQRRRFTKKTTTTPNSVRIHAQQTKLKTNPHLQNKCRKFFKTKALDFRVPRRPKPQQQKQGLLKAGKQASKREGNKKRAKNKAPNGIYKHDDKIKLKQKNNREEHIHVPPQGGICQEHELQ